MIKIATPISNFFFEKSNIEKILNYTDVLEAREFSYHLNLEKIKLMHFDIDLVIIWSNKIKKKIIEIIKSLPNLDVISFQCSKRCQGEKIINGKYILFGDVYSETELMNNSKENIEWLKCNLKPETKIAVENNNFLNTPAYEIVTDGEFISKLVEKNKIYLLLDIAHAKITSINKKIEYAKYYNSLPISSIIQLHVCNFTIDDKGFAFDTHEEPDNDTYEYIQKITNNNKNIEYITLEYYKDLNKLVNNLKKLNNIFCH